MSKKKKALEKIRNNPKTVSFRDLETILIRLGFRMRQSGSHCFFTRGDRRFGFPNRQPYILPVYVKHFLQLMDELEDDLDDEDE